MRNITRRSVLKGSLAAGIASVTSATSARPESSEPTPGERALMAASARGFLEKYQMPGLSVAIAWNGRLSYVEAFGLANRSSGEKVTPAHLFRVASASKPITSAAIFSLVERGKLKLEDKVFGAGGILESDYGSAPRKFISDITIDHLLTHAVGDWSGQHDPMFTNEKMNHRELISWGLDNMPLAAPPGHKFAYSNFGYCVLGRVIEKITGQRYDAYLRDSILAPCGISAMRIAGSSLAERADAEVVYYKGTSNPYAMNMTRNDSTGGWLASAADLVRFATHLGGLAQPPSILQPETVAIMTTPSAVNPHYARGWVVRDGNWEHSGALPGTTSIMVRTQTGLCWAALTNSNQRNSNGALDRLARDMVRSVKSWIA